jgi:hypothetical protein
MVALPSLLFRIIAKSSPLLIPIDRSNGRIQIQCDALQFLKTASELHEKIKVEAANLPGNRYLQEPEKTADGRLNRKRNKACNSLKDSVSHKNIHLPRPAITQKTSHTNSSPTCLRYPICSFCVPPLEFCFPSVLVSYDP